MTEQIDLSAFCKTKAQARDFLNRIAAISARIYETNFQLEAVLLEHLGIQQRDAFLALMRTHNVPTNAPPALKTFLSKLQEQLLALPVLTMTLAFEPKEKTLSVLSDWFHMNLKHQVLFDISVDPTQIAGITISFNGKHLDYTIRQAFSKLLVETFTPPVPKSPPAVVPQPSQQQVEQHAVGK